MKIYNINEAKRHFGEFAKKENVIYQEEFTSYPSIGALKKRYDEEGCPKDRITALERLMNIAECLNAGWDPDYVSVYASAFFPNFDYDLGTFSYLCVSQCFLSCSNPIVYETKEIAEEAGKTFIELYQTALSLPKNEDD